MWQVGNCGNVDAAVERTSAFPVAGVENRGGCGQARVDVRFEWQPWDSGVGSSGSAWQAWDIVHFGVAQRAFA